MSKREIIKDFLIKNGSITTLEIQKLVWCTCPHSIIRELRKIYGEDTITDKWIVKTKTIKDKGKEKKVAIRFKQYFWNNNTGNLQTI